MRENIGNKMSNCRKQAQRWYVWTHPRPAGTHHPEGKHTEVAGFAVICCLSSTKWFFLCAMNQMTTVLIEGKGLSLCHLGGSSKKLMVEGGANCCRETFSEKMKVPYKLPVSLSIGSCVIIKGTPILSFLNDPQLQVDFHTGMDEDSEIAFHFRVHFGHRMVMNSREFGIWKLEEKSYFVPCEDGEPFELRIYVRHSEYEVKVNGQRIYSFVHRLPPSFVKMMQVCRDIFLTSVCVCN
ncbi:galactoside-binding soluble lectin 13-like [Aotus nancymaae]|uniref:galactoside-binding soluble lectin 13-like n=1 Tax=Aotus nancymaae TaxID=37293 RepID=UPI0030FE28BA